MAPQPSNLQSLSLPLKTRILLKLLSLVSDTVRRDNGTVNRRVFNLFDRRVSANPTPINSVSTHDITVDPTTNLSFRLFLPHHPTTTTSPIPVIVFFHGGGFTLLSPSSFSYDAVCRRLARRLNAVVCSVDYRLAPENKFPCQYEDGISVLQFLDTRRHEIPLWPQNASVSRCFIAGDSAGGNISHNVTVTACTTQFSELRVIGLINIQPFFGGMDRVASETELEGAPIVSVARTRWMWNAFLPDGLDTDHWAVNVSGPNAVDITGLDFPETLLFIGGFDPLKDWQRRYYEWLRKSGKVVKLVEYPTAIHAFYVFPELPQATLLFAEVQHFIHNRLSKL
ncbi:putative carboxylesterase 18 [Silene latifolia]|uniref:putative carboxylesterase 18 n=1 Tax=Silene latifolia TaxID=37657 RepID=UPI003D7784F9